MIDMNQTLAAHVPAVTLTEKVQPATTSAPAVTVDTLTFGPASAAGLADTAYGLVLGYGVLFVFLWLITKSRIGYALVYYSLCLLILFLVATQYRFIAGALANVAPAPGHGNG